MLTAVDSYCPDQFSYSVFNMGTSSVLQKWLSEKYHYKLVDANVCDVLGFIHAWWEFIQVDLSVLFHATRNLIASLTFRIFLAHLVHFLPWVWFQPFLQKALMFTDHSLGARGAYCSLFLGPSFSRQCWEVCLFYFILFF